MVYLNNKRSYNSKLTKQKNKIILNVPFIDKETENQEVLDEWLNNRAMSVFQERLDVVYAMFGKVVKPKLKLRKLTRRWGSYLRKSNTIILNPCLIQASKSAIDFIIAHELCHYYYKEHNSAFYNLLDSFIIFIKQFHKLFFYSN